MPSSNELEKCPTCCESFSTLSFHWSRSDCDPPAISEDRLQFLAGLVLSKSKLKEYEYGTALSISTTNRQLAAWIAESLGWLTSNIRTEGYNQRPLYCIRTYTHPDIDTFAQWPNHPDSDGRRPPDDAVLQTPAIRTWFALDGKRGWSKEPNPPKIKFYATNEDRSSWILTLLQSNDFAPVDLPEYIKIDSLDDITRFLQQVGPPVPGTTYKWTLDRSLFEELKESPTLTPYMSQKQQALSIVDCVATNLSSSQWPTKEAFENAIAAPTPDEIESILDIDWNQPPSLSSIRTRTERELSHIDAHEDNQRSSELSSW